jgi:hypothetical protein
MTQKLLLKPPFRYLHDIFTATMQATGFAQGLYTEEELDAKSIAVRNYMSEMFLGKRSKDSVLVKDDRNCLANGWRKT